MKTLSIVIPHYNNINGLRRLLNSIFTVTNASSEFNDFLNHLKVIVVDDYSDEKYINEIKQLSLNFNFEFISNYKIKSAGSCRNIGLNHAYTDYVLFADSDDFFTNNYWEILLDCFKNDFDIAFFAPKSVFDENIFIESDRHIRFVNIIEDYYKNKTDNYLRYTWHVPWSKLYKTSFLKNNKITFDETIASNDIMFSVQSGHLAEKLFVSNNTFYVATLRKNSLEQKFDINNLKTRMKVGLDYKKYCESCKFYDYPDNCLFYMFYAIKNKPQFTLQLLKYAKRIGVLEDKQYFVKSFFTYLFSKFKSIIKRFKG